jgi:hypothetical protein
VFGSLKVVAQDPALELRELRVIQGKGVAKFRLSTVQVLTDLDGITT